MDEKKDEKKVDNGLAAKVRKLEETVAKLGKRLEELTGFDLDGDGKIGKFAVKIALLLCGGLLVSNVMAGEDEVARYIAGEGNDAALTIEADEGDDAADECQWIMGADGTMHFSLNGTEVLSLDGSGTLTPAGNIPKAAITNALTTAGASIGGNVPIAAVTNAFTTATGALLTNTCVAADGKTNTYVFVPVGGVYIVKSVTTSP